jgi:tRNA 2-thiouridine synthesizing protein A
MTAKLRGRAAKTLDLKGLTSPLVVVKLAKAIKEIESGQTVEAFATDPGVMLDIPAWIRTTAHELVASQKINGHFRFVIRRLG